MHGRYIDIFTSKAGIIAATIQTKNKINPMLVKNSILWGVYLGIALALGTQLLTWAGLGLTNWFVLLTYILVILFTAISLGKLKKADNGKLSFGKAALSVFIIILISRIIFQFYMFIYVNYIDPEWLDKVAEIWTQSMQESKLSSEEIEKNIARFRQSYQTSAMFTLEIFRYGASQFILGILVSLFFVLRLRRK